MFTVRKSGLTDRVGGVDEFAWFGELNHALLEVCEGPFYQNLLFLVIGQQVVPQLLLK